MILGQKLQHSWKNIGTKATPSNFLGNKVNDQFRRRLLVIGPHNVRPQHSPIERK
jgi:hypothetical protein